MNKVKQNCRYYNGCNAPLCPMATPQEQIFGVWYPDEDICRRRKEVPQWVKQQRKVAKRLNDENVKTYFSLDMLKVPFRVTKKVIGIDPDKNESRQKTAWFKRYKGTGKRSVSKSVRGQRKEAPAHAREVKASLCSIPLNHSQLTEDGAQTCST